MTSKETLKQSGSCSKRVLDVSDCVMLAIRHDSLVDNYLDRPFLQKVWHIHAVRSFDQRLTSKVELPEKDA